MSVETDNLTPSQLDSDSASEWCESRSDTDWEDPQSTLDQKSNLKAHSFDSTPPSVPASLVPQPASVPSLGTVISPQYQVPNDQDKYPDLPDYMPYMPQCVPQASTGPIFRAQPFGLAVDQVNSFMQQSNGKSFQPAGMGLQQGFKQEDQPGNDNLLMNYSGMDLSSSFDPSTGQFRPQHFPLPLVGNDFNFNFAAVMPFATSGSQLAMDPSPFAPSGGWEPIVDTEYNSPKPRSSLGTNGNSIPLLCILCEGTPKFSDVSHLLTHISSKGHLSRRFHLDLQAQTDQDIQQRLLQFDTWFEQNGIQRLLKTRQEAKDQKKRNQKKSRRSSNTRETLKSEPDDALLMQAAGHLNPLNQQNWHQGVPFNNSYQTPTSKRIRSVYPVPDSPQDLVHQNEEPIEVGKQGGPRTPTLKGIIHKGMGMFDAATPEMKRIRNQRKHPSVLNKMVLVSESISMTEQVWNESMTKVEHERSVYDTPTDLSSPGSKDEEDGDELPQKKPSGSRAAPKSSAPRTGRLTRSATRAMNGVSTRASRGGRRGTGKRGGGHRGGVKKVAKNEVLDSDEELGIRRGKRSLSVFRDENGDDVPLGTDIFRGRPQGAQGFGGSSFGGQQAGFPPRTAMQVLPSNQPLSSMYGRTDNHQFIMYDKENDRNAFSMQQPSNMSGYYQTGQNMQSGAFNPLYVQRQDHFANVYGQGFDSFKPSNSALQSMNGMGYNGMHVGMNNSLSNDLHNGFNNDMAHALNNGLTNSLNNCTNHGLQFRPGNNGGQNAGLDIQ